MSKLIEQLQTEHNVLISRLDEVRSSIDPMTGRLPIDKAVFTLTLAEEGLRVNPRNVALHMAVADAHAALGNRERSQAALDRGDGPVANALLREAVAKDPRFVYAWVNLPLGVRDHGAGRQAHPGWRRNLRIRCAPLHDFLGGPADVLAHHLCLG